jgi:uncharacterized membrane protein YfcA
MTLSLFAEISTIMFLAATFRTAFGFGEALVAVPLLSLVMPVKVAAPLAVTASIVIALVAVIRDWEHIRFRATGKLLLATAAGIPLGLVLLRAAPETLTKALLGLFLLLFSLFSLLKPNVFLLESNDLIWLFGFAAGVLGGSYGMNGPPLALYGAGRRWSPPAFRATIQAYFLPASALGLVGYAVSGLWTREVSRLFAASLPAVALGIVAGHAASRSMDRERFTRFLYGGLIFVAAVLLLQAA